MAKKPLSEVQEAYASKLWQCHLCDAFAFDSEQELREHFAEEHDGSSLTKVERIPASAHASKTAQIAQAPEYKAPGAKLRGRDYGSTDSPSTPAQRKYAKDLGVDVDRMTKKQAIKAIGDAKKAGNQATINKPSNTQEIRDLLELHKGNVIAEDVRNLLNDARRRNVLDAGIVAYAVARLRTIGSQENEPAKEEIPSAGDSFVQIPPGTSSAKPRKRNQYAKRCLVCQTRVEVGEGFVEKNDQGKWSVTHEVCPHSLDIPNGRYAVEVDGVIKFYVARPDGLYAKASDEEHRMTKKATVDKIVEQIKVDPLAAMKLYGVSIGKCGRCGRTLTDEESRANGLGPICLEKGIG